ncbi:MAG: linear amide C-N hydrolase [Melioribacteraceae bacterium]|nr:linear amide C-N hydrolase [Melioribacteraceae bacterium]
MKRVSTVFNWIVLGIILLYLILIPCNIKGCTAFVVKSCNQILLAKNLDWEISNGIILINKKGVFKTAYGNISRKLSWISKYGSVTFNQFGKEFPLGGMNEKGLVIEELNSWGETPVSNNKYEMNEFQWTQFCLDNFANVDELLKSIDSIVIVPLFINLHYLISDSCGNSAVIEFYNRRAYIYSGISLPYPILSNNHYESSIHYLGNFKGFGGSMKIRNDNTSSERFVKVASWLNNEEQKKNNQKTVFEILNNVSQEDTQWSIIYDISDKSIQFKTLQNQTIKKIKLSSFDFSSKTPTLFLEINNDEIVADESSFKELKPYDNEKLVIDVFEKLQSHDLGKVSKKEFLNIIDYGNSVKCK